MSLYKEANKLYNEKKYEEAYSILIKEISEKNELNIYAYAAYGRICRKLNKQKDFLDDICPLLLNEEMQEFTIQFFADIIGWCIYDLYISNYDENCNYDIIEKSKFIIENCKQKELIQYNYNPLVLTITKVVKVLKDRASVNYKKIIELLELLDPLKLPLDNVKKIKNSNGKEMELASTRETYYQDLTKAYEKTRQFEKASSLCDKALNDISKLHYKNDLWIKARKYYCLCQANVDFDINVEKYRIIVEERKLWFMYYNLGDLLISHSKVDDGFYYLCLAFEINQDLEKKYGVMIDIANILLNVYNDESNAKKFYQAALYYRTINGWSIGRDLEFRREQFNLSDNEKPNLYILKKITLEHAIRIKFFNVGIINMIDKKKGFGFIKPLNEAKNIYFKTKNIKNKKHYLAKHTFVTFEIQKFNNSEEATKIEKI